jgi:hypothetical protein
VDVVVWRWDPARGADQNRIFTADHVNRMRSMLARHLHMPHRLHCFTDNVGDEEIHGDVELHQIQDPPRFKHTRRLRIFDPAMRFVVGPRILQLDLDLVIVDDITSLLQRPDPFVYSGHNISIMFFDAGQPEGLWDWYSRDPERALAVAQEWSGNSRLSDQAVVNYYVRGREHKVASGRWPEGAVVSNQRRDVSKIPRGARIVHLYGKHTNPARPEAQRANPWITEHWR